MNLVIRSATDIGLRRSQNEDHWGMWLSEDPAERSRRGALFMVADGMGGARAGEVASHLAVEHALRTYREGGGEPLRDLQAAVESANRAVYAESLAHPELRGMGTTLTAVVVNDRRACYAHVGDSRAYLIRGSTIRQLTLDHSLVAQLVRDHHLTAEEARVDPRRNVVTRSVGVAAEVKVDAACFEDPLEPGDTLLLSSDGLHGVVSDPEIASLAVDPDLDEVCRRLVELARERGGPDNITVVAARTG